MSSHRRRKRSHSDSSQHSRRRRRSRSRSPSEELIEDKDDEDRIEVYVGEYIRNRYKVLGVAGKGTFGTVLAVYDTKHKDTLALKVIRSVKRYLEAAEVEIKILEKIRKADVNKESFCVRLYTTFEIKRNGKSHVCMGFEKLGRSLYEFIKKNKYRGFQLHHVREFGYQLLSAVNFCHNMNLIHTDLKPENILLVKSDYTVTESAEKGRAYRSPISTAIRLIDFGGATFDHEHHSRIINTRQYRSPEVLLGIGWSFPSDIWSIGCILVELCTGELLFATHEDLEHLALIEKIIGKKISERVCRQALMPYRDRYDGSRSPKRSTRSSSSSSSRSRSRSRDRDRHKRRKRHKKKKRARSSSAVRPDQLLHLSTGRLRWPDQASSRQSIRHVGRAKTIEEQFNEYRSFRELLYLLLEHDPAKRISAAEALEHRFFDRIRNNKWH